MEYFSIFQLHDKYFRGGHKVVSMKEFEQTAGKYQKSFCKDHKNDQLIKACERCKKFICNLCDRTEEKCSGEMSKYKSRRDHSIQ